MRITGSSSRSPTDKSCVVGIEYSSGSVRAVQLSKSGSLTSLDAYASRTHTNHRDLFELLNTDTLDLFKNPSYGTFAPKEIVVSLPRSYYSHTLVTSPLTSSKKIIRESLNELSIHDIANTNVYYAPIKKLHSAHNQDDTYIYSVLVLHSAHVGEIEAFTNSLGYKDFSLSTPLVSLLSNIQDLSSGNSITILANEDSLELIFNSLTTLTTAEIRLSTNADDDEKKAWQFIESQESAFLMPGEREAKLYVAGEDTRGILDSIAAKTQRHIEPVNPWRHVALYPLKPMPKKYRHVYSSAIGMSLQENAYRPL